MADYDVFISHSTRDDIIATRIADALRAAGLIPWLDHDHGITYGDNWSGAIHEAANASVAGLFVMSGHSVRSEYCEAEWNRVLALGKKLYIALIKPLPVADIPLRLGVIQYANLTTNFDAALADLIAAMKGGRDLDPDAPTTGRAKRIGGSFPRYHLDLPLIGRDDELAAVEESLAGNHRITLITGLGGVGKTRLAVEVAARADFADGAIWHEVADYSTLATLTNLIREHLDLPPSEDDPIWEALNRRAVLLVLDNAEVCKEPAAYARRLNNLDTAGGSRVLITSRARWPDLRHAKIHSLAAPSPEAAADILRAMAAAEPPANPPDEHIRELAEAARFHPRLMRYAVRWLDNYPVEHVLETLRTLEGADAEEALKDLVDRTVQLMKEQEGGPAALAALRRLAVCRGGFTFEAARFLMADYDRQLSPEEYFGMDDIEAISQNADPQALATLRRWGLVQLEGSRYEIDPLVIVAVGEDEDAHQAHYNYYEALAWEHDEKQDYLGLDPESANLEAAFERALAAGRAEDALWLFNAAINFLANRGRFVQRMDWIERVAAALASHPDEELKAAAQNSLGLAYCEHPTGSRVENQQRAIVAYQEALRFWTAEAAPLDYARVMNNLGIAYTNLAEVEDRAGNLGRAVAAYREALCFWTAEAAPLGYAMAQDNLGVAYRNLSVIEDRAGNLGRAVAAFREALRFRTFEAAPLGYAETQRNLGLVRRDLGDLPAVIACLREAERYYRQMDHVDQADEIQRWIDDAEERLGE